jgi:uncharacterized repeat protein (TIGR04138 family)
MATGHESIDWASILESAGGYPLEAFEFVRDGLQYTVTRIHEHPDSLPELSRHVSGQQLCLGLRDHALNRWGMMAPAVLEAWNIHRTDDFGRIVFAMIEHGVMSKTPQDSLADFRGVFDFDEAFAPAAVAASVVDRIGRD